MEGGVQMSELNKPKNMSLHLFFKNYFDSVKTQQDSLDELKYTLKELDIAEMTDTEGLIFENNDGEFNLKCIVSDKRSHNFINSTDDKSTNKRTDSDHIRECLFTEFCADNFKIIYSLAEYFRKVCTFSSGTYTFIDEFKKESFDNEDNRRELINFIEGIESDSLIAAWVFVFLCFPKILSERNTDYRILLLKKLLQSGKTENDFQPLDITGNDSQIEKVNVDDIGRSCEIEEIRNEMLANNTVLVHGIGGIGKSYICRKLFWNYYESFADGIEYLAWIQYNGDLIQSVTGSFYDSETNLDNIRRKYENHSVIGDMFVKLALADKTDDKMQIIKEYFSKLDTHLLVFVDNADTMTKEEKKWLNSCKCRMIITSRQKIDGFHNVNINSPSPEYCKEMYIREIWENNKDTYSLKDEKYINRIMELADYHTQTVMLIAKAQICLGLSAEEMLDELNKTGFVLKGNEELIDTENYELTMSEHLTKIFNLLNVADENQMKTIRLFSLLAPNTPIKKRDIKKWFELSTFSGINELVKYGWLNSSGSEYVSIHPVIADVVKYNYKPDFEFALPMINALQNEMNAAVDYIRKNEIIVHSASVADAYKNTKKTEFAEFLGLVSKIYNDMSLYESAVRYNMDSLKILEENNQNNSILYAELCNNLASIYFDLDRFNDSLNFYNSAIYIYEHSDIHHAADIAISYNGIAHTYRNIKEYEKAVSFHQKALIIAEEMLGSDSYEASRSYNGLASVYCELKQYDKALEFYNNALSLKEKIYGTKHPKTAITYNDMAVVYNEIKNYDLSLEYYKKAVDVYEVIYGTNHAYTAIVYHNIAKVYYKTNQNNTALSYFKKSLDIFKDKMGTNHSFTIANCISIAKIYDKQNNTAEASLYYNKALELLKKYNSIDNAVIYKRIGNLYYHMKNYESSLIYYNKALDLKMCRAEKYNLETAKLFYNIASCFLSLNQYEKSMYFFFKSEYIISDVLGEKHIELSSIYYNIAVNYKKTNEYHKAIDYFNKALDIEKVNLGSEHSETLETQKRITEIKKLISEKE